MAMPPTSHGSGARKVRGASGARTRITNMHTDTAAKAASVPALASAASSPKGMNPANTATTTAVNVLTKLDENAYSWQSVQRTAGGVSLPDTEEIILKRRETK